VKRLWFPFVLHGAWCVAVARQHEFGGWIHALLAIALFELAAYAAVLARRRR